jgi:hypothetical protein
VAQAAMERVEAAATVATVPPASTGSGTGALEPRGTATLDGTNVTGNHATKDDDDVSQLHDIPLPVM